MAGRKVGYDIDNVITQTYIFALKLVNKHLGTDYTLDDCCRQTVEESFNLSVDEVSKWFQDPNCGFPMEVMPIAGARDVINSCHGVLDQYFVTARSSSMVDGSLRWFDMHGFLYSPERVFFRNNTPEKKAMLVKEHGLELFTDDSLSNANAIAEAADIPVLLVDFGYKFNQNQSYYHRRIRIVKSWNEIEEELKKLL